MEKVNFGCGLSTVDGWLNFDASPTAKIQKTPIIGRVAAAIFKPKFPTCVMIGDITKGLRLGDSSVDLVYCSHVLEHLSLVDLRRSLIEVKRILKPNGVFRAVLPDLKHELLLYDQDDSPEACSKFMVRTSLGVECRSNGIIGWLRSFFGNSKHLWMWDYKGIEFELDNAGFSAIRPAHYGDSEHIEFNLAEDQQRWENSLGFECLK